MQAMRHPCFCLVENLEESDDVNQVYHNLDITDEMMAEFA